MLKNKNIKYQKRLFWTSLATSAAGFFCWIHYSSINFIPYAFMACLIVMYSFSKIHRTTLISPSRFLNPVFIALSVSFTVISLVFGLHSDVIISYDNYELNSADRFKWFEANEVLNFPISQLECRRNPIINNVDFGKMRERTPIYNLIIVDKTVSVKTLEPSVNDSISKKITHQFNVNQQYLKEASTSALIPPLLVAGLCVNLKDSTTNENVGFYFYSGKPDLVSFSRTDAYTRNLRQEKNDPHSTFINDYFERSKSIDHEIGQDQQEQKTSFNDIVKSLREKLTDDEYNNQHIVVSIISDFINTDPTDSIPDISKLTQIKELNLYVLNGKDHKNPNASSLELVNKMTRNFSNLKQICISNFQDIKGSDNFYNSIATLNLQYHDHKNGESISFYAPFQDFNSNQEAVSKIAFTENDPGNQNLNKYFFRIIDIDNQNIRFPIIYSTSAGRDTAIATAGELVPFKVHLNEVLTLKLPYTIPYRNDRLFIETSSINSNKKEARSITLKPILSETTSYYLIFCYAFFIDSLCFILILPNLFVIRLMYKGAAKGKSLLRPILLGIPIALGMVSLGCFYTLLIEKNLQFYPLLVLGLLIALTMPNFYRAIKEERKWELEFGLRKFALSVWGYLITKNPDDEIIGDAEKNTL